MSRARNACAWVGVVAAWVLVSGALAQGTSAAPAPEQAGRALDAGPAAPGASGQAGVVRFGSAKAVAKPVGAIRVAEYNVENLFDDKDDPALSDDVEDKDMTKPESQRKGLAAALHAIDADIVGLEEVESKEALLWFRDGYLKDMGYEYVASIDAGDERGIEQSVLSRYPIVEAKNWPRTPLGGTHPEKYGRGPNKDAGKPILMHRSPLEVVVEVPMESAGKYVGTDGKVVAASRPYRLTLLVVHQKSGGPAGYWREREAEKTAEIVRQMQAEEGGADRNIVVMGDFNAAPGDKAMRTLVDSGLVDLFADRRKGDPAFITHESGRTIDYILLSPSVEKELIRETRFILGTPARPAGSGYQGVAGPEGYGSDHYPVVMDLIPVDR